MIRFVGEHQRDQVRRRRSPALKMRHPEIRKHNRPFLAAAMLLCAYPAWAQNPAGAGTKRGASFPAEHFKGVRTINGCPAFPATSVFHADLSGAPIDEYATQYMIGHA